MLKREDMEYVFSRNKDVPLFNIGSFIKKYDTNTADDLNYMTKYEKEMSEEDWKNFYEKYKKSPESPILQKIAISPFSPDELVDEMALFLTKGEYKGRLSKLEERDYTLMLTMERNIKSKTATAIIWYLHNEYRELSEFLSKTEKIDDEKLKIIATKFLFYKSKTSPMPLKYSLRRIEDENFIIKILDSGMTDENLRNQLIQNPKISKELKCRILDMGVTQQVFLEDFILESDIFSELYQSVYEPFSELYEDIYSSPPKTINGNDKNQFYQCENIIISLINKQKLPPEKEYELFLTMAGSKKTSESLKSLLLNTKYTQILKEIEKVKNESAKMIGYMNPNMPKEIIYEKIQKIISKTNKKYQTTKMIALSQNNEDFITQMITKPLHLPIETYDILLRNNPFSKTIATILSSLYTPKEINEKILKELQKNKNAKNIELLLRAKINIALDNGITENERQSIQDFLNFAFPIKEKQKTIVHTASCSLDVENKNIEKHIYKIKDIIKNEAEIESNKECQQILQHKFAIINKILKNIEGFKNKDFELCETEYLNSKTRIMGFDFSAKNYHILNFYKNIQEYIENMTPIIKNLEKRELAHNKQNICEEIQK